MRALAVLLLVSCGARVHPAPPGEDPADVVPPPTPDDERADETGGAVSPRAYRLELALDPSATGYTGTVAIDLDVAARTRAIWLDGRDLDVTSATVTVGAEVLDGIVVPFPPEGRIGIELPRAIGPGTATVEVAFAGAYRGDDGLFAQTYRARSYVFSDFEPVDARRAFPCFDEPRWKTPWTVSLIVPEGMTALGNAPVASTTAIGRGLVRVDLATTPPLPTYLVAVAAGPFDVVAAEGGPVPVRIVVPAGRQAAAARAVAWTPEILAAAAAFVDRPVPFDKLDVVAVPRFGGAMENPGLFTVAADILLAPESDRADRKLALVLAHEAAHLWFGDSVTLRDWRDLWINEGLASWMADEVLARWRPSWRTRRDELRARAEAMREDELPGAHPLRPERLDSPRALFDVLTYQKAAAVLHMIEAWVGEEPFAAALRGYLDRHAGASATTDDVLAALAPLGEDVEDVVAALITTAGVPHVDAEVVCTGRPRLVLRRRDLSGDADDVRVPACARWHDGTQARRACALVDDVAELALGERCPAWVHPNADGAGYYRWSLDGVALGAVIRGADATDTERIDAAMAIRTALAEGRPLRAIAGALAAAVRTEIPEVVETAIADYELLVDQVAPPAARRAIAAHLRAAIGPTVRRLGTAPRAGEPADDRRLRPIALAAAGGLGGDEKVVAWARKTARRWLRRRREAPLLEPALLVAARHADARLAAQLVRAAEGSLDDVALDGGLVARALGRLPRERALAALDAGLAGRLPSVTTFALAVELISRRDTARDAADALARHGDWLALAITFARTCDPELVDRLGASATDGATRALERRRHEAARCAAMRPNAEHAARAFAP